MLATVLVVLYRKRMSPSRRPYFLARARLRLQEQTRTATLA
jgi:hypothetical protein